MIKIKSKELLVPIIQAGMGVGVSLHQLAGHVMKCGGMGVLSAAHPGYLDPDFYRHVKLSNSEGLINSANQAREVASGNGILAVNIMVASTDYQMLVEAAVEAQVDAIISGAGLPLELPGLCLDRNIALAPIVSSGKAANLICRNWDTKYQVIPDFIVIEGPLAGGHLGFKKAQVMSGDLPSLEDILEQVQAAIKPYEEKYERLIPQFVAGGIYDGYDIAKFLNLGASGVQMGTRFIATHECDVANEFKETLIKAKQEDIVLVKSPVGLPGRAIKTPLVERLEHGDIKVKRCINCLKPCHPATTPYCISEALIQAAKGNVKEGLFFSGSNGYRIERLYAVEELINELMSQLDEVNHHE